VTLSLKDFKALEDFNALKEAAYLLRKPSN